MVKEKREWQRRAALELVDNDGDRARAAKVVGVSPRTIGNWLKERASKNTSNGRPSKAYIPDQRVSIPKAEIPKIIDRAGYWKNNIPGASQISWFLAVGFIVKGIELK